MTPLTEEIVLNALRRVVDPASGQDIVAARQIEGVTVKDEAGAAHVSFVLLADPARGAALETLRQQAERAVRDIPGVSAVTAVLTAHRAAPAKKTPRADAKIELPGVRHVIAVASGKGGVGKSTTAVNLALALTARGLRTGLLDADIYGPSVPRMLGVPGAKPVLREDKKLIPVAAAGLSVMSIGFMLAEENAVVWRGPMVMGAIQQMLRDADWGDLDILVVDLPPGTGDAQLTVAQAVNLAGVVIVTTPQDIALIDARKGLAMFQKVHVPVLGIVENMSYFECPHCHGRSDIFSHGGGRAEAEKLGCDFLGEIPLDLALRQSMDDGRPLMLADPGGAVAKTYQAIAARVWEKVASRTE